MNEKIINTLPDPANQTWFLDGWFTDDKNIALLPTPFFIDNIWRRTIGRYLRAAGYQLSADNVLFVPGAAVREFLSHTGDR